MKIKTISITNYRKVESLTFSPKEISVLLGKNGAGKTSVLDAIRFAITGKAKEEDIKVGCTSATVEIIFEDGTTVSRSRSADKVTNKVNGKTATAKITNEVVTSKIGVDVAVFENISSIDYFDGLDKKGLTELFLSLLPVKINGDGLKKLIMQTGSLTTTEQMNYILSLLPDGDFGLEDIDKAYTKAYQERTAINRSIKNLKPKTEFDDKSLPKETKEELQQKLMDLVAKEEKAKASTRLMDEYNRQVNVQNDAKKRLDLVKQELAKYNDVTQPDEAVYQKAISDKQQFTEAINTHSSSVATLQANIQLFQKTLNNLNSSVCPISEKLICTTDKSGIKDELTALVTQNAEAINKHTSFIEKCKAQIILRDEIVDKYNTQVQQFKQKQGLEKQVETFVIPPIPDKPQAIKAEDYTALKQEINAQITVLSKFEVVKFAREDLQDEQKDLALREKALELLDARYGIRTLILQQVIQPLQKICDDKAAKIKPGFQIELNCNEGIQVLVKASKDSALVDMSQVSTGEFVLVTYLLTSVIQAITGAKCLIIDNLDKLDSENFAAFVQLLDEDDAFEHVFIGSVDHSDTLEAMKTVSHYANVI